MSRTRALVAAVLTTGLLALSACGGDNASDTDHRATQPADASESTSPVAEEAMEGHDGHDAKPAKSAPLRDGETRTTIAMPGSYTPSAPYGTGTDDYRCFLLDPQLDRDSWLTGTQVLEIFRSKTAPAFEVALKIGAAMAGQLEETADVLHTYSENLGIAYQIRDDLDDLGDDSAADNDVSIRPSIILALLRERGQGEVADIMEALWNGKATGTALVEVYEVP